ncbi:zinc finger protein 250 [Anopheles nili]|uniref:zinc finger protein 250 n=1 Tax=Anopheles nili TaxID=185578 RepID=UPI00237B75AE|nr:zinc finger protein 250 [Anopheles nili]
MCTKSLSCILCGQPNFPSIDALRVSLLKVTARPLKCPICGDELLGLDKLTIHLFGHSLLEDQQSEFLASTQTSMSELLSDTSLDVNSFKSLRKARKKSSIETDMKHQNGSVSHSGKTSPTIGNSQCCSNANHCFECNVTFRNSALLKMHREVFHDASNSTHTRVSPSRVNASDKPFHCHICPKEFKMKGSLKIHMRVVHEGGPKKICLENVSPHAVEADATAIASVATDEIAPDNRTNDVENLSPLVSLQTIGQQQSIAVFRPELPPSSNVESTQLPTEAHIIQIIDPRQLAQVVYLPPNIGSQPTAAIQGSANKPGEQQTKETFLLPSSPPQPQQVHDNIKQWECDVCRKSFTTKYFLKKHNRLHTGEMPYTCGICNKSFTFQQSYHKHLLYHSDEKPHVCSVCSRAFKELSTLHNHQRIHSGEKPFACETCGKCFRQRVSYLVHRRIHTGLMPYRCSGCDKSFRYKVSQRTHKCPASPPGTVVRKTGDLLQKLLQSSSILEEGSLSTQPQQESLYLDNALSQNVAESTVDKQTADYVNRTLDELVKGTYDKLDIGNSSSSSLLYDLQPQTQQLYNDAEMLQQPQPHTSSVSPSFPRIESLCLLSPSAFDNGQLEELTGLKLDNEW